MKMKEKILKTTNKSEITSKRATIQPEADLVIQIMTSRAH